RAQNHRAVRITFKEIDHDFLPHTRQANKTKTFASAAGTESAPARAIGVLLALAVPVELNLGPAVFVGEDGFAGRADPGGGLQALHYRLRRDARWPERQAGGQARELVSVNQLIAFAGTVVGPEPGRMLDAGNHVWPVGVEMAFECKLVAGDKLAAVAGA